MRVLVVGASGLVGSHVMREVARGGHEVMGTFRSAASSGLRPLDLADQAAAPALLDEFRPDWVVHAAGWTWVDGCERDGERAIRENAMQPAHLALLCEQRGARFCYFSTTYVFDGTAGPYREDHVPSPINSYSHSKLQGEQAVLATTGGTALVPRLICVWGREAQEKNFVYQVERAVRSGQSLQVAGDQEGNPTWAGDIAAWTRALMEVGECGIWNLVGEGPRTTREAWLQHILRGLGRRSGLAAAVKSWRYEVLPTVALAQPAKRPLRAGADNQRIQALFPRELRPPDDLSDLFVP